MIGGREKKKTNERNAPFATRGGGRGGGSARCGVKRGGGFGVSPPLPRGVTSRRRRKLARYAEFRTFPKRGTRASGNEKKKKMRNKKKKTNSRGRGRRAPPHAPTRAFAARRRICGHCLLCARPGAPHRRRSRRIRCARARRGEEGREGAADVADAAVESC